MLKLERASHVGILVVAVIVLIGALEIAQDLVRPILFAFVIGVILSPVSDLWERTGLGPGLSALLTLILSLLLIVAVAILIQPMVIRIVDAWPVILSEMRGTIQWLQQVMRGLEDVEEEVGEAIAGGAQGGANEGGGLAVPSTTDALFLAPAVAGQTVIFAGTLFFFLFTRADLYAWLAGRMAPGGMTEDVAIRLRLAERHVAKYFLAITVINLCLGIATAALMMAIGLPSALIWGLAAALANFIMYLGPTVMIASLYVAGTVAFDGLMSLAPPLIFFGLNLIEAQFVTPAALGRRLSISPLLVFLSLVFFLWLWGPLGGFIAIPLVLWIMVLSNEINITRKEISEARDADIEAKRAASAQS